MIARTKKRQSPSQRPTGPIGPYADMWSRPGFLIRRLHQIQVGLFAEECARFDITPVQFGFLTVLDVEDVLDQISLSAAVGVDRTSGADVIKRLQRRGLLTRVQSERDRRAMLVQITADGRALVKQIFPAMVRSQDRFIAPLTAAEQSTFNELLRKIIDANDASSRAPLRKNAWPSGVG